MDAASTRAEAVLLAQRAITEHGCNVESVQPSRVLDCEDWWAIQFLRKKIPDAIIHPGVILIEIDKATGKATFM